MVHANMESLLELYGIAWDHSYRAGPMTWTDEISFLG